MIVVYDCKLHGGEQPKVSGKFLLHRGINY